MGSVVERTKPLASSYIQDVKEELFFVRLLICKQVSVLPPQSSLQKSLALMLPVVFLHQKDQGTYQVVLHINLFHPEQKLLLLLYQHHIKQSRYTGGVQHMSPNKLSAAHFQFLRSRMYIFLPCVFSN